MHFPKYHWTVEVMSRDVLDCTASQGKRNVRKGQLVTSRLIIRPLWSNNGIITTKRQEILYQRQA